MRREKRRAEFEQRYRAEQERKRTAKRKRNSLLVAASQGSDGSAARDPSGRYETRPPSSFLSGGK